MEREDSLEDIVKAKTPWIVGAIIAIFLVFSSYFTVSQGYEAVVTRFGAAQYVVGPGLHFKVPFIDGTTHIDVRELTNSEVLDAGTSRNLPVKVKYSQTWRIKPGTTLEFFKNYGTRERFESVILDPKVREQAKSGISEFDAEGLLRNRQQVSTRIDQLVTNDLQKYPVEIVSSQIEDIQFPEDYLNTVREKEKARESKEREVFELERQNLIAQREVQVAEAQGKATLLRADAEAQARLKVGEAEAKVIELINKSTSPKYIDYKFAEKWNGIMPQYLMGTTSGISTLLQVPTKKD